MAFFGDICNHVLTNLDHQDAVVAFCGQTSMCNRHVVAELVVGEEALTSAPFTADGGHALEVPAGHGFVDAAEAEQIVLVSFGILVNVFTHDVHQTERHRAREQRDQGVLLQLVVEDRSVTLASRAYCKTLFGVVNCNVHAGSCGTDTHACNAYSSGQQLLSCAKESLTYAFEL